MKQTVSLQKKLAVRPAVVKGPDQAAEGAFCPLPSAKGGSFLKGGAVTSAFMSAFL